MNLIIPANHKQINLSVKKGTILVLDCGFAPFLLEFLAEPPHSSGECRTPVPPARPFYILNLPDGEYIHFGPEPLGGGHGYSVQPFPPQTGSSPLMPRRRDGADNRGAVDGPSKRSGNFS